jgi:coproporphyrinogen III oxidase-like Fe-S oxidoreductase
MRLTKFDKFLPIYNWLYPLGGHPSIPDLQPSALFANGGSGKSRALYFHIPFCETICTFCPFVRGRYRNPDIIDAYLSALLKEIELKTQGAPYGPPIRAVFVGGGTPSLLSPQQIASFGSALRRHFDLSHLEEFSFEFEVKSATVDRAEALKAIGVTHARFGAQTFSPEYRRLFNLTSTIDELESAATLLTGNFPVVSCDLLYGMSGQTVDLLGDDLVSAAHLGLSNIDIYPINNLVTQPALHAAFAQNGKNPVSGLTKYYMNIYIREVMRGLGYLPHNGHGYTRSSNEALTSNPVVTDTYSFVYHEHVYGYEGCDVIGFGTNAISSMTGLTAYNTASRHQYISELNNDRLPFTVRRHTRSVDACRPISLGLPYHGRIESALVDWASVPEEVVDRIGMAVENGLVRDAGDSYVITLEGWQWYSCLMYFLMPATERRALDRIIQNGMSDTRRVIERSGLENFPWSESDGALAQIPN